MDVFAVVPLHCAGNFEQFFDGNVLVILAILVAGGGGGARLPSNLGNLGHLALVAPLSPLARRLVYLLETKIARLLAILLPRLAPLARRLVYLLKTRIVRLLGNLCFPTCNLGLKGWFTFKATKIARLLGNLAQTTVLHSEAHCTSSSIVLRPECTSLES